MESDLKTTGVVSQREDHKMEAKQPQSTLNNMIHKNPIIIICGDRNTSALKNKMKAKPSKDTHEGRYAAWVELKQLKDSGDSAAFRTRSKELSKELELRWTAGVPILSFHLTHGDIVIMESE
jgi:hypothetical protein